MKNSLALIVTVMMASCTLSPYAFAQTAVVPSAPVLLAPAVAETASDTAREGRIGAIAGVAGALVGAGLMAEASTYSSIKVDVEVFRETVATWEDDPQKPFQLNPRYGSQELNRTDPFRLQHSPAAMMNQGDVNSASSGLAQLSDLHRDVQQRMDDVNASMQDLKKSSESHLEPELEVMRTDLSTYCELANKALGAWRGIGDTYKRVIAQSEVTSSDVAALRTEFDKIRDPLDALSGFKFREQTIQKVVQDLLTAYKETLDMEKDENLKKKMNEQLATAANRVPNLTSAAKTVSQQIEAIINEFRPFANEKGIKCDRLAAALDRLVTLSTATSNLRYSTQEVAIRLARYESATSSANIGPISNEVLQELLAQNKWIDVITDPRYASRWRKVNNVSSCGGLGTHNTVLYLENMATPILKSATFDPDRFIAAHGKMYTNAFKAAADVFGVPNSKPAATQSTEAPAATSTDKPKETPVLSSEFNVFNMQQKISGAERVKRKANMATLDAISKIMAEYKTEKAPNAKQILEESATSLRAIASAAAQ